MSTSMIVSLAVPWVFWGAIIGLAIVAGRSWVNLLLIPVGITVVLLILAAFIRPGRPSGRPSSSTSSFSCTSWARTSPS